MAVYTKIPASNVAGVMGKTLGKLAGGLSTTANATLNSLQKQLQNIIVNLDQETPASLEAKLKAIEAALLVIEKSFAAIQKSLNAIKQLVKTLKAPVKALKAAIKVIKLIPLPQAPLIVAITTVFSDMLEMLSELVAQIGEICDALLSIVETLTNTVDPIRAIIKQLRYTISLLKARQALDLSNMSDKDKKDLTNLGLFDNQGNNLLDSILAGSSGAGGSGTAGGFYANYGGSGVDLSDLETRNRIALTPTGSSLVLPSDKGDWIYVVYIQSESQPQKPESRNVFPPEGWSENPLDDPCWYSKTTVSGKTGRTGVWSEPERYISEFGVSNVIVNGLSYEPLDGNTVKVLGSGDILDLNTSKTNNLSGILKISSSEEANDLLIKLVDKIGKSSISIELKEHIRSILDDIPSVDNTESEKSEEFTYTGPDGTVYVLNVVVDPKSPTIAPRRYISVVDPGGTIVLEGTKSFTDSVEVLVSEMKVRLSQLLG